MALKLLLVDNYDSFTYNLAQLVEEAGGCEFKIVKSDNIDFQRISSYDKILLSPGPGLPADTPILRMIIQTYWENKSILGICLGHQAIAETFGGQLIHLPAVCHGQKKEIRIIDREEYLFKGLPEKFEAGLYHSWAVSTVDFPKDLRITALSSEGVIMAFRACLHEVRGVQFHPESFMTGEGKTIIANWLNHRRKR